MRLPLLKRGTCGFHSTSQAVTQSFDNDGQPCTGLTRDDKIALVAGMGFAGLILLVCITIWVTRYMHKRRKAARIKNESAARQADEKARRALSTPFLLPRARMPWGAKRVSVGVRRGTSGSSGSSFSDGRSPDPDTDESFFAEPPKVLDLPRLSADGELLPGRLIPSPSPPLPMEQAAGMISTLSLLPFLQSEPPPSPPLPLSPASGSTVGTVSRRAPSPLPTDVPTPQRPSLPSLASFPSLQSLRSSWHTANSRTSSPAPSPGPSDIYSPLPVSPRSAASRTDSPRSSFRCPRRSRTHYHSISRPLPSPPISPIEESNPYQALISASAAIESGVAAAPASVSKPKSASAAAPPRHPELQLLSPPLTPLSPQSPSSPHSPLPLGSAPQQTGWAATMFTQLQARNAPAADAPLPPPPPPSSAHHSASVSLHSHSNSLATSMKTSPYSAPSSISKSFRTRQIEVPENDNDENENENENEYRKSETRKAKGKGKAVAAPEVAVAGMKVEMDEDYFHYSPHSHSVRGPGRGRGAYLAVNLDEPFDAAEVVAAVRGPLRPAMRIVSPSQRNYDDDVPTLRRSV